MNRGIDAPVPLLRRSFRFASRSAPWLTLALHAVVPPAPGAARAVLLLHGATLSGYLFDPPAPAPSLQERLAGRGWPSYALDVRGFGHSTRPGPGTPGFDAARPFARAAECVADVAEAVRFLREERGHAEVALMGFSWGTVLAGCYVAAHPGTVSPLVLYAPLYAEANAGWMSLLRDPREPAALNRAFGAYRWTTTQALRERWDADIPVPDKSAWRSDEVLAAVLAGALEVDPRSGERAPPAFRSPNGPFADLFEAFSGRPPYAAAAIREPVLVVRGEGDSTSTQADARRVLRELGSKVKRYRSVARGSHFALLERSAPALHGACEEFLGMF
jgi:pimeloyl-ACP methyl ester carboxylesterase